MNDQVEVGASHAAQLASNQRQHRQHRIQNILQFRLDLWFFLIMRDGRVNGLVQIVLAESTRKGISSGWDPRESTSAISPRRIFSSPEE